jgi:hypothetical protein
MTRVVRIVLDNSMTPRTFGEWLETVRLVGLDNGYVSDFSRELFQRRDNFEKLLLSDKAIRNFPFDSSSPAMEVGPEDI